LGACVSCCGVGQSVLGGKEEPPAAKGVFATWPGMKNACAQAEHSRPIP
jgi:hypothetical protein